METAGPDPDPGLCLVTWNVNGIRARGEQLRPTLEGLGAHIICLQETRVSRELLQEDTAILEGFNSYFSHSRTRSGYSGVATYCTDAATPFAAEEGLSGLLTNQAAGVPPWLSQEFSEQELRELDSEGRALITKHRIRLGEERDRDREQTLAVINVYCPRADPDNQQRLRFKLRFCQLLQARAEALLRDGENVLVLGDLNTAHRPIDHCQPGDLEEFAAQPGRRWMDGFVSPPPRPAGDEGGCGGRFVDSFRLFHPGQRGAYSCWPVNTGARQTNFGTRIDYVLASLPLAQEALGGCVLLPDVQGSDHCPVRAWLRARCLPSARCPRLCTRYMPEFAGVRQTLDRFLVALPAGGAGSQPAEDPRGKGGELRRGAGGGKRGKGRPAGSLLDFFRPAGRVSRTNAGDPSPSPSPPPAQGGGGGGSSAEFWKGLLRGRPPAPACPAHGEPCVLRTVRKPGPNRGRGFYACRRPQGPPQHPASRCDFFRWADSGR